MSLTAKELYELLPAIYRIRDTELASQIEGLLEDHEETELQILQATSSLSEEQERRLQELLEKKQRGPLEALLSVIAEQAKVVEADMAQLYENWFIETCDEWVVFYIADLLGVRGLHPISTEAGVSLRAFVANTLRYRRRKGTATVLEELAFHITGWRARAVEFFELLGTTQYYNHIRLHNVRTPDLRFTSELELLDTAFDKVAHTVDVRHISNNRGRHNIPNIGLFLWRLQSYPMNRASARPANGVSTGKYTFSPLGYDTNLFNEPQTETKITHLAEEINVPGLLRRRPLYDELEARRQALVDKETPEYKYFDNRRETKSNPVIEVFLNGSSSPVSPDEVMICDLENWKIPSDKKKYKRLRDDGTYEEERPITVAVDPVLGRLTFPNTVTVNQVHVSYAYGFSGDMGGGPYDRRASVETALTREVDFQVGVSKQVATKPEEVFDTLTEAINKWNDQPPGSVGVIALLDNCTYDKTFPDIYIPEGSQLLIVAAKWPEVDKPDGLPGKHRVRGQLDPNELRPHVLGNMKVKGLAPADCLTPGDVVLDGLLVEGTISVLDGNLGSLRIAHSTLVPNKGGLKVERGNERLKIDLVRTISGPILLGAQISKLYVQGSIIDNADGSAKGIEAMETPLEMQMSTIFGEVQGLSIEASNCVFNNRIDMSRRQEGCVRFSYVPDDSNPPRCFRCQPELEVSRQIAEAEKQVTLSNLARNVIRKRVLGWLVPAFTSTQYGHYAYAQLSQTCPQSIKTGADDGSEMGVFSVLKQPQRESNLRRSLDEYLRFGLEAGIYYVT